MQVLIMKRCFCWDVCFRYLAKILAPDGSKDVAVGQPIAVTVSAKMPLELFM